MSSVTECVAGAPEERAYAIAYLYIEHLSFPESLCATDFQIRPNKFEFPTGGNPQRTTTDYHPHNLHKYTSASILIHFPCSNRPFRRYSANLKSNLIECGFLRPHHCLVALFGHLLKTRMIDLSWRTRMVE